MGEVLPVNDIVLVKVIQAFKELPEKTFDFRRTSIS